MTDVLATLLADDGATVERPAGPATTTLAFTLRLFVLRLLLERAAHIVPTREIMPVLSHVKVVASPGRLQVAATDLELSLLAGTELVTVTTPGTAVFPARRMLEIVRSADDGDATITVTTTAGAGGTATIVIGATTWQLKLVGGQDYPPLPEITDVQLAPVHRQPFAAALTAVRYAAARDTRTNMMLIDVRGDTLTASDGVRFAQARIPTPLPDLQIPIGAVDDLLKLLAACDLDTIDVGVSDHHLIFTIGTDVLMANMLTVRFPDMAAQLLRPAQANQHPLTVGRAALRDAIRQVRITADPTSCALALTLHAGDGPAGIGASVTVSARDRYGNAATATITGAEWAGPDRHVVVNHAFLTDLIAAHPGPTLHFRLGEDHRTRPGPILLRDADTGRLGVIGQMRADWVGQ